MTAAAIYAIKPVTTTINRQKGTQQFCVEVKCQAAEQQSNQPIPKQSSILKRKIIYEH